jgi:alkylation response protein AidB-like acyl-CoA dehydrogenase
MLTFYNSQLECVRALYYKCIDDYISGEDITPLATMLKLKSARLARQITDGCLQFWGGKDFITAIIFLKSDKTDSWIKDRCKIEITKVARATFQRTCFVDEL